MCGRFRRWLESIGDELIRFIFGLTELELKGTFFCDIFVESCSVKKKKTLDGPTNEPPNGSKRFYEFGLKQVTSIGHSSSFDPNHNHHSHLR